MPHVATHPDLAGVLEEARKLVLQLEEVSVQLNAPAGQTLCRKARALLHETSTPVVQIDIARPASMSDDAVSALAAVVGGSVTEDSLQIGETSPDARVRTFDLFVPPPVLVGSLRAPCLVIALDESALNEPFLAEELAALGEERARVIVITFGEQAKVPRDVVARVTKAAWQVEVRNADAPEVEDAEAILESFENGIWAEAYTIAFAFAAGNAFRRIVDAFNRVVQQAKESQRVKKAEIDRQVNLLKEESNLSARPLIAELDALVKDQYEEFERGVGENYEKWTGRRTGALSASVEEYIDSLMALSETEFSSQVQLTIPEQFASGLADRLRDVLVQRARQDIQALDDLHEMINEGVEKRTRENLGTSVSLSLSLPNTRRYELFLDNNLAFDSGFQEQSRKQGAYQYMMAARRPAMMFGMMSIALGGVFKAVGIDNDIIGMIVLVLMIGGAVKVAREVPVQREEERELALKKARASMRRDARKIIDQSVNAWMKELHDHLNTLKKVARTRIEERLGNLEEEHNARSNDRLRKKQRLLSSVEHMQKVLDGVERRDFARELTRVVDRLDRAFSKVRPEPATARAEAASSRSTRTSSRTRRES